MKLRNKKTGEILKYISFKHGGSQICMYGFDTAKHYFYNSLAELNEEWEDYEEPKEYWFIGYDAQVECISENDSDGIELDKSIGNYFATKEEAEKAVEKLKAWKRLKDKGFRFKDFYRLNDCACTVRATFDESWSELYDDLNILFGGEE